MTRLAAPFDWHGSAADPNDEHFGDVVTPVTLDDVETGANLPDAVLLGEPYDGAVIGRPGAAEGPTAIRNALAGVKTHHFDAGPVDAVGDLGNLVLPEGPTSEVQATVRQVSAALHTADALPVFLGGDNSLSYANARPLLDRGSLGVVSFDAHLDCRAVDGEPTSGTPYRQLHDDGLDALAVVGARHFETSTAYADYLADREGIVVTAEEVGEDVVRAVDAAIGGLGDVDRVYLSVDVDVLDAATAPGVSAPTPGGLTARELFRALRLVAADPRLAGFEVVETAPPLDHDGRTVDAAARAVAHVLAAAIHGGTRD